ncbi:MAG: NAD(P)H-binding protein [Propionibacteriaceae bacterium]|jgi:putative NADH-flavin reductase|nr:NAD(P)H-binding protein [Propionibacteriaceae bacterium]
MKIAVLGGTGKTGRLFVQVALANGHEVTALVRPTADTEGLDGARLVVGDALNQEDIATLLEGQEAVYSAVGLGASGTFEEEVHVCTTSVKTIVPYLRSGAIKRAVFTGTHGVRTSHDDTAYVGRVWELMGRRLDDKETMEEELVPETTDWLVLRAPRIAVGNESIGDDVAVLADPRVTNNAYIPQIDLVNVSLSEIEKPTHFREFLTVISAKEVQPKA